MLACPQSAAILLLLHPGRNTRTLQALSTLLLLPPAGRHVSVQEVPAEQTVVLPQRPSARHGVGRGEQGSCSGRPRRAGSINFIVRIDSFKI